ncbi:MAG: alanine racemase [bacterium]|nr:alanine racemase [bacterium]
MSAEARRLYEKPVLIRHQAGLQNKFGKLPTLRVMEELDGVPLAGLARDFGTPLYLLSESALRRKVQQFRRAFETRYPRVRLAWSYKTNYLGAVCRIMQQEGSWAEVVSGHEFRLARELDVPADRIIYNGPDKDDDSLRAAIAGGARIHLDHLEEIPRLEALVREVGLPAGRDRLPVAIRVNMQLDAQHWDRFGFNLESGQAHEAARRLADSAELELAGLHTHIGTYVDNVDLYRRAAGRLVELAVWVRRFTGARLRWWDMGGGFATRNTLHWAYQGGEVTCPSLQQYAEAICPVLATLPLEPGEELPELFFETGRALVDEAMHLLVRVVSERRLGDGSRALVVDAGVNLLSSTAWYRYDILPVGSQGSMILEDTTLLGNLCMQIDVLRKGVPLPALRPGDLLVVRHIGAYNLSQSLQFIHGRPAVVLVDPRGGRHLVRQAETPAYWRQLDQLPPHLQDGTSRP